MKVTPGTRLADRYVITGEIGAGGMGIVVRARDEKLGRTVAIKVLPPDAIGDDSARRRLVREARAAASLDHRGIVHVYDVGETDDGGTFFIMELVRGKSLGTHLREGTLNRGQRLVVMIEVARALAYAHAQGFAHRDIKPDNVMIRDDGSPVILDFGLAKAYQADLASTMDALSVTAKGGFVGTPAYVSPEQARGETVDPSTDQFALAVATFEAMSGRLPWEGTTPIEVVSEILKGTPMSLRDIQAALPIELDRVLAKALSKKKADRYASIDDFADALAACLPDLGVTSGPVSARSTPQTSATLSGSSNPTPTPASISATKVSSPAALVSATKVSATAAPSNKRWAFAAVTLAAIGGGFVIITRLLSKTPDAPLPKPAFGYATNDAWVLACPPLEAQDTEVKATGFLGAAASTLVCSRAQLVLGGRSARTIAPAELLDLPREPREGFPEDAYEPEGARAKAIAAAKQRADVWVDGRVESSTDMHVSLVLRDKKGDEIARADARQLVLVDAVRDAMAQLRTSGALPDAHDASVRERTLPGVSIDAALLLHDMAVSDAIEDKDGVRASCAIAETRTDLGSMQDLTRVICARVNGKPLPPEPAPPAPDASAITLATYASVLRYYGSSEDRRPAHRDRASRIEDAAMKESDGDVRAVLSAAAAEIHYHALSDASKANALSRSSIQASPKELDLRGIAWHRITFSASDISASVLAGETAWAPWHPFGKSNLLRIATGDTYRAAGILARRGYWALAYGEQLCRLGKTETARGVAVQTNSNYLLFLVTAGSGKPGEALLKISDFIDHAQPTSMNGLELAQVAALGVDLAVVLGKPMTFAETYLHRFVDPANPNISKGVVPFFALAGMCASMPKGPNKDCAKRLRALFSAGHFGAVFSTATETIDGLEKWVAGDTAGAAKAWRPITRSVSTSDAWSYPFIDAFESSGEVEIAARLDGKMIEQDIRTPNADSAWVREAKRAEKRGDLARAKSLAQTYLDRWDTCDERSKAWPDMKKLLARVSK